jgi:hypothetical protein
LVSITNWCRTPLEAALFETTASDFSTSALSVDENELWSKVFCDAHQGYQHCCREQRALQENNFFIERVAAGIARLPISNRLEVQDEEWSNEYTLGYLQEVYEPEAFIRYMLRPMPWEESTEDHAGQRPSEMILKLPSLVYKAGRSLEQIYIHVSPPEEYSCLSISEEGRADITAAIQNLKFFEFTLLRSFNHISHRRRAPESTELAHLLHLLSAFLDTASLEIIEVRPSWKILGRRHPSLGAIATFIKWPKLRNMKRMHIPIHLSEIQQLVHNLDNQTTLLTIYRSCLFNRIWTDCLDILR